MITGAGGFLGNHLIKQLYDEEYNVVGIYRNLSNKKYPWLCSEFDMANRDFAKLPVDNIDCIIHCAAVIPTSFFSANARIAADINIKMDSAVVKYCAANGITLIYPSGTGVYGFTHAHINEQTAVDPLGSYTAGKLQTENLIQDKLDKYAILRISAPYGPGQKHNTVLKLFIENAIAGEDITYYGTGSRKQDFTYVSDVTNSVKCCLEQEELNQIFNIASGRSISMKALAQLVVSLTPGCESKVLPAGKPDLQENYRPDFDITKARNILNWEPKVSLESGIKKWINVLQ